MALVNGRTTPNPVVLTPCARNGIFRYYADWNNGNVLQIRQPGTATPTIAVVDGVGNAIQPDKKPDGSAFTGTLHYASVFGPVSKAPTKSDCSDAVIGRASTSTGTW